MSNLDARLKRLEAAIAARKQQQESLTIQQKIDALKDIPYEELLAEYEQFINAPRDPEFTEKLNGMTDDELIKNYIELCRKPH